MTSVKHLYIIYALLAAITLSCRKDQWKDRNSIKDPALAINLAQLIEKTPELSRFYEYLVKTGYDKIISASKTFTVWAPTNAALENVDPAILNDTALLRQLVGNHISGQSYLTAMAEPSLRIRALNGKNITFSRTKVEDAAITTADEYAANGILHVIDGAIIPKQNAWEYLNSAAAGSLQLQFLQSLSHMGIDTTQAEQIGVDPETGRPIYKPGTGLVQRNSFLDRVNINNEDSLLTYIILTDEAFNEERNKLSRFFVDSTTALSDSLTSWNVIRDLAFNGVYSPDELPAVMYSIRDSVKYHLDKSAIVSSRRVSNGMVYVMSRIDYEPATKIKPVIVEGEYFTDMQDRTKAYSIRTRLNALTGLPFRDLYIANHGISAFWVSYQPVVNSVAYKVYWVAVNDFQTGTFPMRVAFDLPTATQLPYKTVELNDYTEVYLGDYTPDRHGLLNLYLVGNNVTGNGLNTLVLDYIKLVPVLN